MAPQAIEDHTAGRWQMVALQESAECHRHDYITRQFMCAILFNKHTFEPDVEVGSKNLLADKVNCGGCSFEAFCPKLAFDTFLEMES